MNTKTISQILSDFIYEIDFNDLPDKVQDKLKLHTLDTIGVILGGSAYPASKMAYKSVFGTGMNSNLGPVTVIGMKSTAPALIAAFINGTNGHGLEFDDGYNGIHPGAPIIPSSLAAAQLIDASGKKLLEGIACGYEVAIRIHKAIFPEHRRIGFHPTGTCATFGAAAAAGKIIGLNSDQITNALGLAGTQVAGLREGTGAASAMMKRIHAGKAASNGLLSALLAKEGYLAPSTILEGKSGFLNLYSNRYNQNEILSNLGKQYNLVDAYIKPYPTCRHMHGPIQSLLSLRNAKNIMDDDIKKITVEIYREGTYFTDQNPTSFYDAQFSMPYVLSAAAVDGELTLEQLTEKKLQDCKIKKLCRKVEIFFNQELDDIFRKTHKRAYTLNIQLKDGTSFNKSIPDPKGSPADPLLKNEIEEKFIKLVTPIIGNNKLAKLLKIIENLSELDSTNNLGHLLI